MAATPLNSAIKINYQGSGNNSQFTYDGLQCNVKILDLVLEPWAVLSNSFGRKNTKYEVRDATEIWPAPFLTKANTPGVTSIYGLDHVGSTETVTDSAGNWSPVSVNSPFGTVQQVSGTFQPNILFTGFYSHNRSGLFISQTRQYNSNLGRWLSRDPCRNSRVKIFTSIAKTVRSIMSTLPDSTTFQSTMERSITIPFPVTLHLAGSAARLS